MIYSFSIIFSIIFMIVIILLVRKNKLDEKYSILWLIFAAIILLVSAFPSFIINVAAKFGVYYPPTLMLLFGLLIIGTYIVHITIVITKQNKMIVKLAQELAVLKEKVDGK